MAYYVEPDNTTYLDDLLAQYVDETASSRAALRLRFIHELHTLQQYTASHPTYTQHHQQRIKELKFIITHFDQIDRDIKPGEGRKFHRQLVPEQVAIDEHPAMETIQRAIRPESHTARFSPTTIRKQGRGMSFYGASLATDTIEGILYQNPSVGRDRLNQLLLKRAKKNPASNSHYTKSYHNNLLTDSEIRKVVEEAYGTTDYDVLKKLLVKRKYVPGSRAPRATTVTKRASKRRDIASAIRVVDPSTIELKIPKTIKVGPMIELLLRVAREEGITGHPSDIVDAVLRTIEPGTEGVLEKFLAVR